MARAGAHGQIMSCPGGQFVSPERDRLRLALAEGGSLLCSRAGGVLGCLRVDETASGGDAGLASIPCVLEEPGLVLWVDGTAVVCVGAALRGFCGVFCAAPSAVNCAGLCSQRLLRTKASGHNGLS